MTPEERARMAIRGYNMPDAFKAELEAVIAATIKEAIVGCETPSSLRQAECDLADSHIRITQMLADLRERPQGSFSDEEFFRWRKRARYAVGQEQMRAARLEMFLKDERAKQHQARMEEQQIEREQKQLLKQAAPQPPIMYDPQDRKQLRFLRNLLVEVYVLLGKLPITQAALKAKIHRFRKRVYAYVKTAHPNSPYLLTMGQPDNYDLDDPELVDLLDRVFGSDDTDSADDSRNEA